MFLQLRHCNFVKSRQKRNPNPSRGIEPVRVDTLEKAIPSRGRSGSRLPAAWLLCLMQCHHPEYVLGRLGPTRIVTSPRQSERRVLGIPSIPTYSGQSSTQDIEMIDRCVYPIQYQLAEAALLYLGVAGDTVSNAQMPSSVGCCQFMLRYPRRGQNDSSQTFMPMLRI